MNETIEFPVNVPDEYQTIEVKKSLYLCREFWKMHYVEEFNELSQDLYDMLKKSVDLLRELPREHITNFDKLDDLLNRFTIFKIHKFQ